MDTHTLSYMCLLHIHIHIHVTAFLKIRINSLSSILYFISQLFFSSLSLSVCSFPLSFPLLFHPSFFYPSLSLPLYPFLSLSIPLSLSLSLFLSLSLSPFPVLSSLSSLGAVVWDCLQKRPVRREQCQMHSERNKIPAHAT